MAQIHRFYDTIAVHLGGSATVYLSQSECLAIARHLIDGYNDLARNCFQGSTFGTREHSIINDLSAALPRNPNATLHVLCPLD